MSESAGITLIETQLKAVTNFSASNVSVAEWGILNSGASDHYAIIKPGPAEFPQLSLRIVDNSYRTVVEVWQRYKDDGTTLTTLMGHIENIKARIRQYRKLADTTGTLRDANVTGLGEVVEKWTKDGGLGWLERDVYIDWTEETNVTYAE